MTQAYLAHQLLKALSICGGGTRFAQITINHHDPIGRPTQGDSPLTQGILALGAFSVFDDLTQCGLTDVEEGLPLQVLGCHFCGSFHTHRGCLRVMVGDHGDKDIGDFGLQPRRDSRRNGTRTE